MTTKTSRIPIFQSRQEEAEWFDTHDITDYLDEFKPVNATFAKNLSQPLSVRVDTKTLDELRTQAKDMGLGIATLARLRLTESVKAHARKG